LLCVAVVMDWMATAMIVGGAVAYILVEKSSTLMPKTCQMTELPGASKASQVELCVDGKLEVHHIPQVIDNFAIDPGSVEAEIAQVVRSCTPSAEDKELANQVARDAEEKIIKIVPGAKVHVTVEANLQIIGEVGDKPELNMVVTTDDAVLRESLVMHILSGKHRVKRDLATLQPLALRKTATKMLALQVVFGRFWRSQLTGLDPVIVLIIPTCEGYSKYPLRVNLSVNNPMPMRLVDLLKSSCEEVNHLSLLVIKFARQRCMINISRGQPTVYTWALLVSYFVRQHFSKHMNHTSNAIGELFSDFLKFYKSILKPSTNINIRFTRQAPRLYQRTQMSAVYIEDPADLKRNCAEHINDVGLARVSEEIERALLIMSRQGDGRIPEILQRWIPADRQEAAQETEEAGECPATTIEH